MCCELNVYAQPPWGNSDIVPTRSPDADFRTRGIDLISDVAWFTVRGATVVTVSVIHNISVIAFQISVTECRLDGRFDQHPPISPHLARLCLH